MVFKSKLSPELLEKARKELHEDPDRIDADIAHIKTWLQKQPHINARTDDYTIMRYLRGSKYSLERTKEKIDTFYTCKALVPEWYQNRDPQDKALREILNMGLILPLPGTDKQGRPVMLSRFGLYDPHKVSLDLIMVACYMVIDLFLDENEVHSVTGVVNIMDCSGMSAAHMLQFTPPIMKKMMVIWQDGYPMRPKGLHYINTPPSFDALFSIAKSFMNDKMKKRIAMHGSDMTSLHKAINKEVLPKEFGGTNGNIQDIIDYWIKRCDERRDWLISDCKFKVNESKRPGKPKTTSDLFGIEGSFRKLNVD